MKRREPLNPDITPLIDVVFILLIFFLVSSTFKRDKRAIDLTLPKSSSKIKLLNKDQISISLNDKELSCNGKRLDFEELKVKLTSIKDKDKPIYLNIDESVRYKRIIKLLDILKTLKLTNLSLVSRKK